VRRIVIQVNGVDIGQAGYGQLRPLVTQDNPGFVDSLQPGFGYFLNSTDFTNEIHRITAKVVTFAGNEVILPQFHDLRFINNTAILKPFGNIDLPLRNTDLYGSCDLNETSRIYTPVIGWALDLGVEIGDQGVGYVELLIDGAIAANSKTSCFFSFATGGFSNCYGLSRLDVERMIPFALNAPNSGFRFVLDIGMLITQGQISQGNHTLTIRAGDISTQVANIAEVPVNFFCDTNLPNEGSFGFIESPNVGPQYSGTVVIQGWALDIDGISRVEVFIDGAYVGNASYGVDSRPSVAVQYPGFPNALAPVFRFLFDSNTVSDGVHQLELIARDLLDHPTEIGEMSFIVENRRP
jgi:Bacterial Ig domain